MGFLKALEHIFINNKYTIDEDKKEVSFQIIANGCGYDFKYKIEDKHMFNSLTVSVIQIKGVVRHCGVVIYNIGDGIPKTINYMDLLKKSYDIEYITCFDSNGKLIVKDDINNNKIVICKELKENIYYVMDEFEKNSVEFRYVFEKFFKTLDFENYKNYISNTEEGKQLLLVNYELENM